MSMTSCIGCARPLSQNLGIAIGPSVATVLGAFGPTVRVTSRPWRDRGRPLGKRRAEQNRRRFPPLVFADPQMRAADLKRLFNTSRGPIRRRYCPARTTPSAVRTGGIPKMPRSVVQMAANGLRNLEGELEATFRGNKRTVRQVRLSLVPISEQTNFLLTSGVCKFTIQRNRLL
jgi:hypothetical protein